MANEFISVGPMNQRFRSNSNSNAIPGQPPKRLSRTGTGPSIGLIAVAVDPRYCWLGLRNLTRESRPAISASRPTSSLAHCCDEPVTVAGIPVGTVAGMHLNSDHVTVDIEIFQNNVDLGKDYHAVIMVTTILGSRYMALHPDRRSSATGQRRR